MKYQYFYLVFISILFVGCGLTEEEIFESDTMEIINYLEDNNLLDMAEVSASGLYYIIHDEGNSTKPGLNDNVECAYTGYLPNGDVFDSSSSATFVLGGTIEGWREGIPLIGEGGSIQLFVPSGLAYGTEGTGSGTIGPNQVIFFDVDLINVN